MAVSVPPPDSPTLLLDYEEDASWARAVVAGQLGTQVRVPWAEQGSDVSCIASDNGDLALFPEDGHVLRRVGALRPGTAAVARVRAVRPWPSAHRVDSWIDLGGYLSAMPPLEAAAFRSKYRDRYGNPIHHQDTLWVLRLEVERVEYRRGADLRGQQDPYSLNIDDYKTARPDQIFLASLPVISHLNQSHPSLIRALWPGASPDADVALVGMDQFGVDLEHRCRIMRRTFPAPLKDIAEAGFHLIHLARQSSVRT